MKLIISIVVLIILICLLYGLSYWLYKYYKNDINDIEKDMLKLEERFNKKISDLEYKQSLHNQLISWLSDEASHGKRRK